MTTDSNTTKSTLIAPRYDPPYPRHALPERMRLASDYIHQRLQTPYGLGATEVLSAMSMLAQGMVDITSGDRPLPTSLIFIIEARPAIGKSGANLIAFEEIDKFEARQRRSDNTRKIADDVARKILKAKESAALKKLSMGEWDEEATTAELEQLRAEFEQRPTSIKLKMTEVSLRGLLAFAAHNPLSSVRTDEFIIFIKSGAASNFGYINKFFDGHPIHTENMRYALHLEGIRYLFAFSTQPELFDGFLKSPEGREFLQTGTVARTLHCGAEPRAMRSMRLTSELPDIEPYHALLRELLELLFSGPSPERRLLQLSEQAARLFEWFGGQVELAMQTGGYFYGMVDHAGRSCELVLRVAGILLIATDVHGDKVGVEVMRQAIEIVSWHLNQHRLRYCPLSQMEKTLVELEIQITRLVNKSKLQRRVMGNDLRKAMTIEELRKKDVLVPALREMERLGFIEFQEMGRGFQVELVHWFPEAPPQPTRQPLLSDLLARGNIGVGRTFGPDTRIPERHGVHEYGPGQLWPGVQLPA